MASHTNKREKATFSRSKSSAEGNFNKEMERLKSQERYLQQILNDVFPSGMAVKFILSSGQKYWSTGVSLGASHATGYLDVQLTTDRGGQVRETTKRVWHKNLQWNYHK